jgi:hypothetical protein
MMRASVYPVLLHILQEEEEECMEDCIGCITLLVQYETDKNSPISRPMWALYTRILMLTSGH